MLSVTAIATADTYSTRHFGGATLAAFDAASPIHRARARLLRERLVSIGFGPDEAAALFGVEHIAYVRQSRAAYYDSFKLPASPAGDAARFFVLHQAQPEAALGAWLGDANVAFLRELAALADCEAGVRSLVSVTWFEEMLVLADARAYNAVWPGKPYADYVMPPGGDSIGLATMAPRVSRAQTLDLCCGAGAQALAASPYSEHVTGVDINPRALRFARFNAAANGVENVTFVQGDLYAPLGDARFDAIVANPPFVPWPQGDDLLLYRGGGPRGEDVLERILAGVGAHLNVPGTVTICADLADVDALGARIAVWQGANLRTAIVLERHHDLLDYAEIHAAHYDTPQERQAETLRLFSHMTGAGITTLDFGYVLQDGTPGPAHVVRPGTLRTRSTSSTVPHNVI